MRLLYYITLLILPTSIVTFSLLESYFPNKSFEIGIIIPSILLVLWIIIGPIAFWISSDTIGTNGKVITPPYFFSFFFKKLKYGGSEKFYTFFADGNIYIYQFNGFYITCVYYYSSLDDLKNNVVKHIQSYMEYTYKKSAKSQYKKWNGIVGLEVERDEKLKKIMK